MWVNIVLLVKDDLDVEIFTDAMKKMKEML